MQKDLVGFYYTKVAKSLKYLDFTYKRVKKLDYDPKNLTEEQLELWDSFAVRFARSSDLFLTKFITAVVKRDDPAFDGGFRDRLNKAEKLNLLSNVPMWMEIRELRNVTVHEYSEEDLKQIFKKLLKFTPTIINLEKNLLPFLEL